MNGYDIGWGIAAGLIALLILFGGGALVILLQCLFLNSVSKAVRAVNVQNRRMQPGSVWLNLIPVFSLVWIFVTVAKVGGSVRAENESRGMRYDKGVGYGVGFTYAALLVVMIGLSVATQILESTLRFEYEKYIAWRSYGAWPWILLWVSLGVALLLFIFWIAYWVKCSQMRRDLEISQPQAAYGMPMQYQGYPGPYGPPPGYGAPGSQGGLGGPVPPTPYAASIPPAASSTQAAQAFCGSCGNPIVPGNVFCSRCGAKTANRDG